MKCYIILDLPVCKTNQETILMVKRNQLAVISCEMDANPTFNMKFSWTFNTTNFSSSLKVSKHMVPFIVTQKLRTTKLRLTVMSID